MNPAEFLYHLGFSAAKHYSLRHRRRLPYKVVSIGNITTGGTGKTPAVIALAEEAKVRGLYPIILTRGYRGKAKGPCFVTRGEGPLLSAEEAGDEPFLMAKRLEGIPVVKGRDRYEAGCYALENIGHSHDEGILFILDDGFQHWRLHRDKDIVLIDAANPFGNGALLPFGRLRELPMSLGRADVIVLSKSDAAGDLHENASSGALVKEIRRYNQRAPIFPARHKPVSCSLLSGEESPPQWLSGKKVFGLCAIGDPLSFQKTVLSLGARLIGCRAFRDHHLYTPSEVAGVLRDAKQWGAEWIVTTEKDMMKLGNLDLPDNIVIIRVSFSADAGFYEEVLAGQVEFQLSHGGGR